MSTSHGNQGEKYTSEEWNRFDAKKTKNTQDKILDEHDNEGEKYTSEEWNRFIDAKKEENTQDKILNEIEETRLREPEKKFQEDIPSKDIIPQILNKHLEDNFIIHSSDRFVEAPGPKTTSATTVTYKDNTSNGTRFVKKYEDRSFDKTVTTVTEVIAGSLYRALLHNKAPAFRLVETTNKNYPIALKSKLLDDFVILGQFMLENKEERILDLIYEKFANEDGQKELTAYMAIELYSVENLKDFIERYQEKMKGSEAFFDDILERLSDKHVMEHLNKEYAAGKLDKTKYDRLKEYPKWTKLEGFLELKDVLVQVFERLKDKRKCIHSLFTNYVLHGAEKIIDDKKALTEEEVKRAKVITDGVIDGINRELSDLEEIITYMALLGYHDLHGGNIGIMNIKREDRDGNEVTKKVYAKVDMSASFDNLGYTSYLQYIRKFTDILIDSRVANEDKVRWHAAVDYSKLKEKINEATDLFIKNTEYVKSLIHRALFYTKPLLKTEEELGLVNELAEKVIAQAKLLKEFANSEEFTYLKEYIDSRHANPLCINWVDWARDNKGKIYDDALKSAEGQSKNTSIIARITKAVEDNLRIQSEQLQQNPVTKEAPNPAVTPKNYTQSTVEPVMVSNTTPGANNGEAGTQFKTGTLETPESTRTPATFSSDTNERPAAEKIYTRPVEQPQKKPIAKEAPIPTVVGTPQDPEPEVKFPDDVTFLNATNGETDSQPITGNGKQPQPEAPIYNPVAPSDDNYDYNQNVINKEYGRVRSEDDVDQQQNLQTQTKNNSKYYYIGAGATAGLAIGPTIAYFAGAAALAPIIAAIAVFTAAAVVGALVVALVGYVVSKCLKNPNVESHKQPELVSYQ